MTRLTVALLGEPRITLSNQAITCASKKALGLFFYLAQTGRRQSRRDLARLFWGGANEEAARTSLRTALQRLPASLTERLTVDREHIELAGDVDLDTARFATLAGATDVEALAEAARLYNGELLKNLELDAAPEFDDWLHRERTRYRQLAQAAFEQLVLRHRERARADATSAAAALAAAQRWVALEPGTETAHRWLMQLHLDAGRREAAHAQYETCQRELAVAFGRAPGTETRALFESIAAGTGAAPPMSAPATNDMQVRAKELAGTSFVGRVEELAALEQLMADPACRLLTLHAMGGMGKSRLAFALANQVAARFALGAAWIALDAVQAAEQLAQALARALRIELPARGEPGAALCQALRAQQRLLVLDNFEHLLAAPDGESVGAAAELVLAILRDAPGVRVLVTTREVLGVQEEWIYEVRGLGFPLADTKPAPAASQFPAVELFMQRARQAYLGFSAQAEWPHVVRICRLVDGHPLALELAAAWVRTIPCGDLAQTVETEMAALAARHHNRPLRHQSLDAVVRTSWSLLTREQQQVLAALSIFVGGFSQEASQAVAQASLRVLSALVDKALVYRHADGRLGLHELVRQFAHAQRTARADAARLVRRRYAAFHANLLRRCCAQLEGPGELEADAVLFVELPNLLHAAPMWLEDEALDTIAEPMLRMLIGRGLIREARDYASRLLEAQARLLPATRAMTLALRGRALLMLGDLEASEADFAAAIRIGREFGLQYPLAYALVYRSANTFHNDRLEAARAQFDEVEPLLAAIDDPGLTMRARYTAGIVLDTMGRAAEGERQLREALDLARTIGAPTLLATVQSTLALPLLRQGRLDEAERLLREALVLFERVGRPHNIARTLNALCIVAVWRGEGAQAAAAANDARRSVQLFEQMGYTSGAAMAADSLGQALMALGDHAQARAAFERSAAFGTPTIEGDARFHLAQLELEMGRPQAAAAQALRLVELARSHDLVPLRRRGVLMAAAIAAFAGRDSQAAARWLRALLAEPDLDFEAKRRAEALAASLAAYEDEASPAANDALEEVTRFLQPFLPAAA